MTRGVKAAPKLPPKSFIKKAHIKSMDQYNDMFRESLENPEEFWSKLADELYWHEKWPQDNFMKYNFDPKKGAAFVEFMKGAKTNMSYNCIDRWMKDSEGPEVEAVKVPFRTYRYGYFWEGNYWDEPTHDYAELTWETMQVIVCKCANIFKSRGVKKGDRVVLYLPMVFQLPVAMLGLARIGAVHVNVTGGMSAEALAARVLDCGAELIVTLDGFWRGTQLIKTKEIVDEAIEMCRNEGHDVKLTMVVSHLSPHPGTPPPQEHDQLVSRRPCYFLNAPFDAEQDEWWSEEFTKAEKECEPEWLDAEDPLFITYTSGTTGKPKAVVHTLGGYMLYAYATFKHIIDYQSSDGENDDFNESIYWSTHDMGGIGGITYGVYGPYLNGATILQFEGIPTHPDPSRIWALVQNYQVEKLLLSPEHLRIGMGFEPEYCNSWKKETLTWLGSSADRLSKEAHRWYQHEVGENACPVVDTYLSAESGSSILTCLPGATPMKPGAVGVPYFGVDAVLLDDDGAEISGAATGNLCVRRPWPGMARDVYGDEEGLYTKWYFEKFPGYFWTGDVASRDADGFYEVEGQAEDQLQVGGKKMSPHTIEAAIISHEAVFDAAVVSYEQTEKSVPYAFVRLKYAQDFEFDERLVAQLKAAVRERLGADAVPQFWQQVELVPTTWTGRVARRLLRLVAAGDGDAAAGDQTTLTPESLDAVPDYWQSRAQVLI